MSLAWQPLTSLLPFLVSRLIVCFDFCVCVFVGERSYPPVASGWLFVCEFVCVCLCWWEVSSTCSQRQADGDGLKTGSAETRDGVRWASDQLIIIMCLSLSWVFVAISISLSLISGRNQIAHHSHNNAERSHYDSRRSRAVKMVKGTVAHVKTNLSVRIEICPSCEKRPPSL